MMAPQQYYPAGTSTATGSTWEHYYVTVLLDWAKENLNVDPTRIYLTGLSLGGGGTVDCMGDNAINTQIAAAVAICPGYGNGSDTVLTNIAKCGVQMWIGHAENDEATNPCRNSSGAIVACSTQGVQHNGELVGQQIVRRVNAKAPLVPIKYFYFTNGGHAIWYRFYDRTPGDVYPMMNGQDAVFDPGFFSWLLRYKRRSFTLPYYP
jgi:predicted peptidase